MPLDNNTMLIGGAVLVVLLIVFFMPWGGKCDCSEKYKPSSPTGKFTEKRPKYMTASTHPQKMPKEGFIIPLPNKAQTLKSNNLHGGTIGPTSNPYMGGLHNEGTYGVSVPSVNSATLTSGNGKGDPAMMKVWSTVI